MAARSMLDWTLYRGCFCSDAMGEVFSERSAVRRWVETERALCRVQARLGIAPAGSGPVIDAALDAEEVDLEALSRDTLQVGRPIVGLVRQLTAQVPPPHDAWVHHGITTYDVMDTATVLQVREAIALVQQRTDVLREKWEALASRHRSTLMVGRTNGQHAQPTTFGARIASYLEEFLRHQERLDEARQRALTVQLGSMVGTLASVHPDGLALRRGLALELGLHAPITNWHNNRDGLAAVGQCLGLMCASIARIARDTSSLASTDFAEVHEGGPPGRGRSSGMAHKRNPRACEFAEALGHLGRQRADGLGAVMGQEHERSGGTWIAEWVLLPEVFMLSSAAIEWCIDVFTRLQVDCARMRTNLDATHGMALSERLTLFLATRCHKAKARALLETACATVRDSGRSLEEVLAATPEVMALVNRTELSTLMDPASYLGHAPEMVDAAVTASKRVRHAD